MFSFGNIIISTLTHEWPNPGPPNQCQGDQIIGLSELQRRERYIAAFTAQERQLFLPIVHQCLENRPDKRPSSVMLVRELRHIESSLPTGSHVAAPIEQLRQQLSAKEEECRQKDEVIREKDEMLMEKEKALKEKDEVITEKEAEFQCLRNEKKGIRPIPEWGKKVGYMHVACLCQLSGKRAVKLPKQNATTEHLCSSWASAGHVSNALLG